MVEGGKKNYPWIRDQIGAWVNLTGHTIQELKESEELQIQYHPENRPLRYHENPCLAIIPSLHGTPAGDIYNAINSSVDGRTLNTHVSPYFTSEAYYARQHVLQQQQQQRQQQAQYSCFSPDGINQQTTSLQPQQNDYYSGATPRRSNVNESERVPQPSPHYAEQQQYPNHHEQFVQLQNNNSPDEMSLASSYTQQSTAAMSLTSDYTRVGPHQTGAASMNHGLQRSPVPYGGHQGGNNSPDEMSLSSSHTQQSTAAMSLASGYTRVGPHQTGPSMDHGLQRSHVAYGGPRHQGGCYSPAPGGMNNQQLQASPRRSKSYQKKSRSTVSPKRQEFRSASQRRQKSSAISRSARDEQLIARRQQLPQPTDLRDLFNAPSSGGNQPYENVQQRSTQMPVGLPTQPEGGGHMSISDPASDGSQPYLSHEKMTAPQPQGYRLPASEGNQSYLPNKNTQEGFNFNAPQGELGFDTPAPPSQDILTSNTSSAHRGANGGGISGLDQRIFSGPAFQNFRESSDHLSSSQDNTHLCIDRDLPSTSGNQPYSGFLHLLAHLEQYAGCQLNPFQVGDLRDIFIDKVDVSRGVPPQMEFETLDDLLSKIRMVPNEQDAHELLNDEITAGWFTDVIRQKKTNLLGSIKLALKGVDNSQRLARKKANRISNFYAVLKAIADKTIKEDLETIEILQKKVQASRTVQTNAVERINVLDGEARQAANYKDNTDVIKSLKVCLENNVVPPPSVVQAALERFTNIDDHWKGQLQDMAGEYQDDGTILSSSSRSTLRTLTEFFAHINLHGEAGMEQRSNTMVPIHLTANCVDENVSVLGMNSVYQHPQQMAAVPNIQPNNHVQRATSPSPSVEDASAANVNDAMSQLQMSVPTGGDSMSVTSNTMTINTINSITGESSVKAPVASGLVKAPSLPTVEDVSVDGSESSLSEMKHTKLRPNKAAGDLWMTPLQEMDGHG